MKTTAQFLQDMVDAVESIETYAVDTFESFQLDHKSQDAIFYNLIILGEAANQIPDQFQEDHPEVPWSAMIGLRHVIVHGYDQVKLPIVWDVIQKDLLPLKQQLLDLLLP